MPRFQPKNLEHNKQIIQEIKQIADCKKITVSQLALTWLMHQDIVPIPGTTKESHLLSNIATEQINLTADELTLLNNFNPAQGGCYTDTTMKNFNLKS
jgi:aryl-alcohol dehydrogenase-like predicted oxidoreductase